jgi:hypothetical protein
MAIPQWCRIGCSSPFDKLSFAVELANLGQEVDALMAPYTVGARPAGARPEGTRHVTLIQVALPEGPAAGSPAQTP